MADESAFGAFSGEPELRWLTSPKGGRKMTLLRPFTFTEAASGRVWEAPQNLVVDGTSIPRALWTFVGSPYTGDYRRASIVHDKACEDFPTDGPERKAADEMFMLACRAGGCGRRQARLLYLGVRIGSSWAKGLAPEDEDEVRIDPSPRDLAIQQAFREMALELDATEPAALTDDPVADVGRVRAVVASHGLRH